MKSCKIFASALIVSLMATTACATQRRCAACGHSRCNNMPRNAAQAQAAAAAMAQRRNVAPARPAAQAQRAVPAVQVIGQGARIVSLHNPGLTTIWYQVAIDAQQEPAPWVQISKAMPVIIQFNQNLTMTIAADNNGRLQKQLIFNAQDLPGKTILLHVCRRFVSNSPLANSVEDIVIQPDAVGTITMQNFYRSKQIYTSIETNITQVEIDAYLAATNNIAAVLAAQFANLDGRQPAAVPAPAPAVIRPVVLPNIPAPLPAVQPAPEAIPVVLPDVPALPAAQPAPALFGLPDVPAQPAAQPAQANQPAPALFDLSDVPAPLPAAQPAAARGTGAFNDLLAAFAMPDAQVH